ncbi:hypothetical protein ACFQHO_15225 [Actinomadura yumaensis]|uniref:hypothetical protein n=1 Tax=Actinomadura yumaensis TaxID=111807 RepID=UPI00360E8BE7
MIRQGSRRLTSASTSGGSEGCENGCCPRSYSTTTATVRGTRHCASRARSAIACGAAGGSASIRSSSRRRRCSSSPASCSRALV